MIQPHRSIPILGLLVLLLSACSGAAAKSELGGGCIADEYCTSGLICVELTCVFPMNTDGDNENDTDTEADAEPVADGDPADQADREPAESDTPDNDGLPPGMVLVPAGEFSMGCNTEVDQECNDEEYPYHQVYLDAFAIDIYEVTVLQYAECVNKGSCSSEGLNMPYWDNHDLPEFVWACNWGTKRVKHPINCLDWNQAVAYCAWKGKRLPTEAEWEKAARGTDGRKYTWGNKGFADVTMVANIADATLKSEHGDFFTWATEVYDDGYSGTSPIGSYPAGISPYGALDMIGNDWEWVSDWWGTNSYSNTTYKNPQGLTSGQKRGIRGGSWYHWPKYNRASFRGSSKPNYRSPDYGIRCVKDMP